MVIVLGLSSCEQGEDIRSFEGERISEVTFRHMSPKTVDEARLRNFMTTRAGIAYTTEDLDSDLQALWESGLVDDVRFVAEPEGDDVRLIVEVWTRPGFGPVRFVGNAVFSDKALGKEIGLGERPFASDHDFATAVSALVQHYEANGYATVNVVVESFDGGEPTPEHFVFRIDEGEMDAAGSAAPEKHNKSE